MKDLDGLLRKMVLRLSEDINTPRSLTVALLVRSKEWEQLLSLRIVPEHYTDPEQFARDNLITEFLRKLDSDLGASPERLAKEAWDRLLATERLCCHTNKRMMQFLTGPIEGPSDLRIVQFLEDVKKHVRYIVGPIPETLTGCGFGPGATLTTPSRLSTIPDKIESCPAGTARQLYIFDTLFPENAWDRAQRPHHRVRKVCRGNRFFTVPKTALSYRGAALPSTVGGYLQKGVGRHFRGRLASKANIHIGSADYTEFDYSVNDYTSSDVHRRLAKLSSVDGSLVTIDLSDASNTIAKLLIQATWPDDWYALMCDLREPFMETPEGGHLYLEMFSAMGNGFTFEMETITFWAICKAAGATTCSVFGDDIIVNSEAAADVIAALRFCGFMPNARKTFTTGEFRESCGGDYFAGVNVRAHYVKTDPTAPQHWMAIANGLRRFCDSSPTPNLRWHYVRRSWWVAVDAIPRHLRDCRGPQGLGDLVIYDPDARFKERNSRRYFKAYAPVPTVIPLSHWADRIIYASALLGISSDGVSPRDSVSGYRVRWICYS